MSDWDPDKVRLDVARDLREIERMFAGLRAEAVNRAGDPNIPGGAAMVMLGPRADIEAWNYIQMSALAHRLDPGLAQKRDGKKRRDIERAEILNEDIEPPLSFLAGWADIIAENRGGAPANRKATIKGEIKYIREALEWMTATDDEGVPWWLAIESFADGLHKVRSAMENALKDGQRADRIRAECKECDDHPRLVVHRPGALDRNDFWQCPNKACRHIYDEDGVARCWRDMLVRRPDAPEWLPLRAAAAAIGRGVSAVHAWTRPPLDWEGKPKLDNNGFPILARVATRPGDGCTEVYWAHVRAVDDITKRRRRTRSAKVA